jgi:type IV secretory pathway TraG/TraD family ATPase VirD4
VAQLQIYGSQANTLVDNAGVIQLFGARNRRMAQDFANLVDGVSADEIMNMPANQQILPIDGKMKRCRQTRYYGDNEFSRQSRC